MRKFAIGSFIPGIVLAFLGGCQFEPDIEPLVFPTLPPQPFSTYNPDSNGSLQDFGVDEVTSLDQGLISTEAELAQGTFGPGMIAFAAVISMLSLIGLRQDRLGPCVLNGVLTIANGIGTLLLATGVAAEIGVALLAVNLIAQILQIASDIGKLNSGQISQERFNLSLGLNVADMIPGVGVLSGIFSLMGTCVFDWALDYSGK